MEANVCDVNHLESDVLLPPRKRLLACLKKQNGDGNGNGNSYSPSTSRSSNEFDSRIDYLLRAHLTSDNPSQEELVKASRSAAEVALKVAVAARAAAVEKAVMASNAMAAAKRALELVATVDEHETLSSTEPQSTKNKTTKHVEVQMLYNNNKARVENGKTSDEELARKLHQAINSSPRISKCGSPSDLKSQKHKRLKRLTVPENGRISNEITIGEGSSRVSNGNSITNERVLSYNGKVDENMTKINKSDISRMEYGGAKRIQSKGKFGDEDSSSLCRKRGRMKQKKLPLSICHDKDQASPKEFVDKKTEKATASNGKPLFSVGPSAMPVERNELWKCKAFKAPTCVEQDKVIRSRSFVSLS